MRTLSGFGPNLPPLLLRAARSHSSIQGSQGLKDVKHLHYVKGMKRSELNNKLGVGYSKIKQCASSSWTSNLPRYTFQQNSECKVQSTP
eukprot:6479188-Amphidinium_carterae.2